MSRARGAVERASGMSVLRPRRMLRGFGARARSAALQRDRSSTDCSLRMRRNLELVLRSSPLRRCRAGVVAQKAVRAGGILRALLQPLIDKAGYASAGAVS